MAEEATRKRRVASKGWLTRAINRLHEIISDENSEKEDFEHGLQELNKRIDSLEQTQAEVEVFIAEVADLEEDIKETGNYLDEAAKLKVEASKRLSKLVEDSSSVGSHGHTHSTSTHGNKIVKLPTIQLPKFRGDVTKFKEFWDQFSATIDESDLPIVTKFTYLKSLLEDEAKTTIDGLTLTQEHYKVACDILKERFGRSELIVFSHNQSLLNLKPDIKMRDPLSQLKSMMDQVNIHVRSLEALGIDGSTYGVTLTPVILSRLPSDVRMEWAREGRGKEGDLEWLLAFLRREIERRERADTFTIPNHSDDISSRENRRSGNSGYRNTRPATATALHSQEQRGENECAFCHKSNYRTDNCWSGKRLTVEERKDTFMKSSLCFKCALPGHSAKSCHSKCSKCGYGHHQWICASKYKTDVKSDEHKSGNNEQSTKDSNTNVTLLTQDVGQSVMLQVVKVTVKGPQNEQDIYALFDSGSDKTYVTSNLIKKLKLKPVTYVNHRYAVFGGGKSNEVKRSVVNVSLMGENQNYEVQAVEVPVICAPLERPHIAKKSLEKWGICVKDEYNGAKIKLDMLIGLDNYWKLMSNKVIRIQGENLVAQESVFGYVLSGSVKQKNKPEDNSSLQLLVQNINNLSEDEDRRFWDLEHIGILPTENRSENEILKTFHETVEYKNGRYIVELPWREGKREELQSNEDSALGRARKLQYKLCQKPDLKQAYDEVFREWEHLGIIEEVSESEDKDSNNPVYYLPHRPVVREDHVTTKVRPVFDASAKSENGVSLNDCLHAGPNLLPDLVEVLIRFRRHKIALNADVSKAFLQICLKDTEKDVHRFIWLDGQRIRKMRFCRVTFGIKSSPFILNATVKHHLNLQPSSKTIEELEENLYMDDWLSGAEDTSEATQMYNTAKDVMKQAGMELTKWHSSDKEIIQRDTEEAVAIKILGVRWSHKEDVFLFDGVSIPVDVIVTKRIVLSVLARIFDPLGFIAPVIMTGKILFQHLWRLGLEWDEEIPPDLCKDFKSWINGFEKLKTWKISRKFAPNQWNDVKRDLQLCVFSDASESGYGAVVYLLLPQEDGTKMAVFVISRAKVTPLKKVTLPRLELLACLLAARLLLFVKNALKCPEMKYTCFSDSQIALGWIRGDPFKYKQFVANRVQEIQKLTDPQNWRHIPGKENPADLLTRGVNAKILLNSEMWLHGASVLTEEITEENTLTVEIPEDEMIKEETVLISVKTVAEVLFEIERWSSINKAISIVKIVLKAVGKFMKSSSKSTNSEEFSDTDVAKTILIKQDQKFSFPEEVKNFSEEREISKSSKLYKLSPFLDKDGLLRVKGRIERAEISYSMKHPIIIDKTWFAKLLVRDFHQRMNHAGVDTVITAIRNQYWIIGLRRLVKSVIHECLCCQKVLAQRCNQSCAPLPLDRLIPGSPFNVTGVDYAGPVFVIDNPEKKLYICLFTCATTRAIHLELSNSLSTPDFILSYRRFVARRSLPKIMYSDNAKTFKCAEEKLKSVYGHDSPNWKFIVPRAPWWGGWWERMVRNVKVALRKCLGTSLVSRDELMTLLIEIENTVNSRPLTQVTDAVDNEHPITPNDFLMAKNASSGRNLIEILDAKKQLLQKFWKIWVKSYLLNLPKIVPQFKEKGKLKEGSLVLIQEDNVPRLQWPLGIVKETICSADGKIRSVKVKTAKNILIRPVQRLCHLEAISHEQQNLVSLDDESDSKRVANSRDRSLCTDGNPSGDANPYISEKQSRDVKTKRLKSTECIEQSGAAEHFRSRSGRKVVPPKRLDL